MLGGWGPRASSTQGPRGRTTGRSDLQTARQGQTATRATPEERHAARRHEGDRHRPAAELDRRTSARERRVRILTDATEQRDDDHSPQHTSHQILELH